MLSDTNSEKALLACLYRFGEEALSLVDYITEDCFTTQEHAVIFNVLKKSVESGLKPDLPTMINISKEIGFGSAFQAKDDLAYLRSISNYPASLVNTTSFGAKLKKIDLINKMDRTLLEIRSDIQNLSGSESISSILDMVDNPISRIMNNVYNVENAQPVKIFDGMEEYIYEVLDNPSKYTGISTGFTEYDRAIGGGLRRAGVDVIAARAKCGKSSMGLQIATNVANRGIPVLIVDTEMTVDGQRNRAIANQSMVDVNEITSAHIKSDQSKFDKVIQTAINKKDLPFYHINVAGKDFKTIINIMAQWVKSVVGRDENGKTNDCIIIYDYLKLTTSEDISRDMKEYQAIGFQMNELYNFMIKHDCPCLTFLQLNRDLEASQSDRIVWFCTSFAKFLKKEADDMAFDVEHGVPVPFNRKLIVTESRFGAGTENDYINLRILGKFAKIDDGPLRSTIESGEYSGEPRFEAPDIVSAGFDTDPPWDDAD